MKLPKTILLNWVCSDYLLSDFISNLEMKYMKLIQSIDAMIVDLANQKEDFETQIKEMNTKKKTRQDQVNSEWER